MPLIDRRLMSFLRYSREKRGVCRVMADAMRRWQPQFAWLEVANLEDRHLLAQSIGMVFA
jgi:hypothetical protein